MKKGNDEGVMASWMVEEKPPMTPPSPAHRAGADWQVRLRSAQRRETLGHLASTVGHDINNMLTVIRGYTELLLQGLAGGDPTLARLAGEIQKATVLGASWIKQLLALSRPPSPKPVRLDLGVLARDLEVLLRHLVGKAVEFTSLIRPGTHWVEVGPGQIEQVLLNLVLNARDAMPQGGHLFIEVGEALPAAPDESGGGSCGADAGVMLAVTDTGCGMDAATQARLFEPFFTTKGPGQGTGLGLVIVRDIVQQTGGSLRILSTPGRGTTVRVVLPRATSGGANPLDSPPGQA